MPQLKQKTKFIILHGRILKDNNIMIKLKHLLTEQEKIKTWASQLGDELMSKNFPSKSVDRTKSNNKKQSLEYFQRNRKGTFKFEDDIVTAINDDVNAPSKYLYGTWSINVEPNFKSNDREFNYELQSDNKTIIFKADKDVGQFILGANK